MNRASCTSMKKLSKAQMKAELVNKTGQKCDTPCKCGKFPFHASSMLSFYTVCACGATVILVER